MTIAPYPSDRGKRQAPPAFQEYAAQMLADPQIRQMAPGEVGLMCMLRWLYWVSGPLPADTKTLAKSIGWTKAKVEKYLTPRVLSFFDPMPELEGNLDCPELRDYKLGLDLRRKAQSEGGRIGAQLTNFQRHSEASRSGYPTANPPGSSEKSTNQFSRGVGKNYSIDEKEEEDGPPF